MAAAMRAGAGPRPENGEQIVASAPRPAVDARATQAIVDACEAGTGTWRMAWQHSGADVTRPTSVASGKPYRGINTVSLWAAAYGSGYASGVWGTYRQWQALGAQVRKGERSEEHTSELQSLMRISYAVFCLKKKKHIKQTHTPQQNLTTNQ